MNPYEAPNSDCSESASERSDSLRRFTGNYYIGLGWFSVASTVVTVGSSYWTDYLYFDFAFILWFWLGKSLRKGVSAARKWAIAVSSIVILVFVMGLFVPGMNAKFASMEFDSSHPAYYAIAGGLALVFGIPGAMLVGEKGRAAFAGNKQENKPLQATR